MAKRRNNRYRQMESMMTKVLIGDAVVFCLYMIFAGRGVVALKVICAVLSALTSVLSLGWLFITREFARRRSLWMVTACISLLACLIISLILKYPCPPITTLAV